MKQGKQIVEIDNVSFCYGSSHQTGEQGEEIKAIDGLNLTIEEGSFTAIIGRNGSGKSTLSKHLNGLLLPTEGTVYIGGFDTNDENAIWQVRQLAAMVFQNPDNQLVSSIVEDDIAFGPENLGVDPKEIRKRVNDALKAVGMEQYSRKSPHMLSGGQKQRIAIAGAIAMRPKTIIFDEPTAMLDPAGRKEIMNILKQLHNEGITIILVTHFMEEAALGQRIIVMDRGKVLLDGSPQEVFQQEEFLEEAGLKVPYAVKIAEKLRDRGIEVPVEIITEEGLVEYLCQYV